MTTATSPHLAELDAALDALPDSDARRAACDVLIGYLSGHVSDEVWTSAIAAAVRVVTR